MPELPELETIASHVRSELVGSHLLNCSRRDFIGLAGKKLVDTYRSGKALILDFGDSGLVEIHFGLVGDMFISDKLLPRYKFCMGFDNRKFLCGMQMLYGEVGWFKSIQPSGVDPTIDEAITADALRKTTWMRVKDALMAQHIIGGVGNIYANETLFLAGQNPFELPQRCDCDRIARTLRAVLLNAIEEERCTAEEYLLKNGMKSHSRRYLVYGREGQLCDVCSTIIQQDEISGRKTFYCPKCQGVD